MNPIITDPIKTTMKKTGTLILLMILSMSLTFAQTNTGTLKIFSDEPVMVYVDNVQYSSYDAIPLAPGTHYLKVMNKDEIKVYGNIITIVKDQVTSVLIDASKNETNQNKAVTPSQTSGQPAAKVSDGTGTIKIYTEINGISVYLNDIKQGDDIKEINSVPAGKHYLKIIKDGVSIYADLVTVTPGETASVLVKNDGQVADKLMEGKVKERENYQSSKIDVLFASKSVSTATGSSTLFPGYYGYFGYSKSLTSTAEIADFKIIKGGVQEIGDIELARLVNNQNILDRNAADNVRVSRRGTTGAIMLLSGLVFGGITFVDLLSDKKPFLHKAGSDPGNWEYAVFTIGLFSGIAGYRIVMSMDNVYPDHYYSVDKAAQDAQTYNKQLKEKLGLPEGYDVK